MCNASHRQECPTELNPLTYRSLLPQTNCLPQSVEVSDTTYFTLSSKWARTAHNSVSRVSGFTIPHGHKILRAIHFMVYRLIHNSNVYGY